MTVTRSGPGTSPSRTTTTANFTLTVTPATIDEGDDAIVTLDTGGVVFDSDETITLVLGGSATATEDYTITPASITIAAGQTSGTATLAVVEDAIVEGSETIAITARHGTTDTADATVTITDGDAATFSLDVDADAIAEEGTGSATVTVDTGGVTFATAQTIALQLGGSATAAEDYTITPASITIAANETSGSATVTALDDTAVEGEETITIAATHDATPIGSVDVAIDDDDEPQFTLAASAATVAEGESTIVTVDTGGVTFATAQTIALQLGGTAAAADYTITPASITIAAGQTSGSATIAAVDDTLSEDAETIAIAASHGGTAIGSVEITISASDQTTFSLLLFPEDAAVTEGESATVTVDTGGVSFDAEQTIVLTLSGSATAADDYTITPASITIAAGQTAGSATITTVDDAESEGDETITIAASHEAASIGTRNLTIIDNDADFSLTVIPAAIAEGDDAVVTVDTGGVSFDVEQTIALTLTGSATVADDYTITPASITIAAGQTTGSATISAVDDTEAEDAETITITASHDGAAIGTIDVTILASDQTREPPAFTLEVSSGAIAEGESTTVTVDTGGATFATEQTITLTLTGSATAADDYTIMPASITIAAGETSGSATITALHDTEAEDAETITIAASHDGAAIGTATVTILAQADDVPPGDDTKPEVTGITSTADLPANAAFMVTITFSEPVTGLAVEEIEVTNGVAASLAGADATYTVEVTPRAGFEGTATVTVPADAATDAAGNGNVAGSAGFAVDTRAPTVQDATLDKPVQEWTSSTDTGAGTSSGLVRYSGSEPAGASDGAAATAPAAHPGRSSVTLTYDEALDEDSTPAARAFAVRVDGIPRRVSSVAVSGNRVRLALTAPVAPGRRVTVSYTAPAGANATPIRDLAGNAAPDVDGESVAGNAAAQAAPAARDERANRALLPYVATTMHAGTLAAVGDRIDAASSGTAPASRLALGSVDRMDATGFTAGGRTDGREPGMREVLTGMAFAVPLAAGATGAPETAAGAVALWGSGGYRSLSGGGSALRWSGDLTSVHVGADLRVGSAMLGGVAVSWSRGAFDYTDRTDARAVNGTHATTVLSVHPYASWSLPEIGLGLWMTAGYGWGDVEIDGGPGGSRTSDARLLTGAVGGSGRLLATDGLIAGGVTQLRLKGDGALALVEVTGSGPVQALALDTRRLRLSLEASHAQRLAWGARLTAGAGGGPPL